jgi:hypothetical protein
LRVGRPGRKRPGVNNVAVGAVVGSHALVVALTFLACPVAGLVLGIIGLRSKQRKRITAGIGVCLNGLVLLLITAIIVLAVVVLR